jgi:hypothetical protein
MIERTYKCNLCRDKIEHQGVSFKGFGLHYAQRNFVEAEWRPSENHICHNCVTSIQALPKVCIQGIVGCGGGLKCTSDHK